MKSKYTSVTVVIASVILSPVNIRDVVMEMNPNYISDMETFLLFRRVNFLRQENMLCG